MADLPSDSDHHPSGTLQARVAALLLLTLRGTLTIYMGDELGMVDTTLSRRRLRSGRKTRTRKRSGSGSRTHALSLGTRSRAGFTASPGCASARRRR
jgi:hypothetical protein